MCSAEVLLEIFGATFGHQVNGNTRGVRGDEGAGFAVFFDILKNLLFDVQALNDYFYNPVTVGDAVEVIFGVAGFDEFGNVFGVDGGGFAFEHGLESIVDDLVAVTFFGRDI